MSTVRPLRSVSRALFGIATAVAAVALVVAHIATGPGVHAAADDLLATGAGQGGSPHVRTFGPTGAPGGVDFLSAGTTTSGASVAVGDVTGDGVADIVTGSGAGAPATVQVWSRDGKTILSRQPRRSTASQGASMLRPRRSTGPRATR